MGSETLGELAGDLENPPSLNKHAHKFGGVQLASAAICPSGPKPVPVVNPGSGHFENPMDADALFIVVLTSQSQHPDRNPSL